MTPLTRSVGRYDLLDEIGRGGMGMVWRARQTDLRRIVAVKELRSVHEPDPALAQRFVHEARLAGSLIHPNVVTVFDFFEHEGIPYIAMEYLPHGSLRPYMRGLSLAQTTGVFEGLLSGLARAEREGIVHRDLKPENLMVSEEGQIKISDFGIAKASGDLLTGGFRTMTGMTIGTPAYMAPEQAMGQQLGPWTDLYAVGVIAFEVFTGTVPFSGKHTPMAVMYRHVNEPIPPVESLNPGVHEQISLWIERLLVKDPARRLQSATQAWEQLEEIVIDLLGARWRHHAQLTAPQDEASASAVADADDYETFGKPFASVPGPATPPPADLPPGPMTPPSADVPSAPPMPARPPAGSAPTDPDDVTHVPHPPLARDRARDEPAPDPARAASVRGRGQRGPSRRGAIAAGGLLAALVVAVIVVTSGGDGPGSAPAPQSTRIAYTYLGGVYTFFRTLDVVQPPRGAVIDVSCRGLGCPPSTASVVVRGDRTRVSLTRMFRARRLRPGALVEVRVTAPDTIGRLYRIRVHRASPPTLRVLCQPPGGALAAC